METMSTRFIVVAGGVISGVGKGVATASIAKIIKEHGYRVTVIKIDPYINYDAGTLRPTEHGEVWVTEDGGEIDQDLGTYERFLDQDIPKKNNITTGQIYKTVIDKERRGEYLGQTVQFIPHIIDEIITRIKDAAQGVDIAIVEVGGTVGDYENVPFLYALKALERERGADHVLYILVTYLPVPGHIHEMKTKPTLQAVRLLGEQGILPDFIICRSHVPIDHIRRKKIEECAHIRADYIIAAPDVESVYEMPVILENQGLGKKILDHFKLSSDTAPSWQKWQQLVSHILHPEKKKRIAIIGKYQEIGDYSLTDSYISIYHALMHTGASAGIGIEIEWVNAQNFEQNPESLERLTECQGIIVPGGFGSLGVEGKIAAISYARKYKIPYLGLCYGMQLAVVEFARNVCLLTGAHTSEVDMHAQHPVVTFLPMQHNTLQDNNYGGSMRLGSWSAQLKPATRVYNYYHMRSGAWLDRDGVVHERHRHRYEVNPAYVPLLEEKGLVFSGSHMRADGTQLMEFVELPDHPFFVGIQAHPEFKSRMGNPHPLFSAFVAACCQKSEDL